MERVIQKVNRGRKHLAVRMLRELDESTGLPSAILLVIVRLLPSSAFPPQLTRDIDESFSASERVRQEVSALIQTGDSIFRVCTIARNPFHLHAFLRGPSGSLYDGGLFQIEVKLPRGYPDEAPSYRYLTKVVHTDIEESSGAVDLANIIGPWCNAFSLSLLLTAMQTQLSQAGSMTKESEDAPAWLATNAYALWPPDTPLLSSTLSGIGQCDKSAHPGMKSYTHCSNSGRSNENAQVSNNDNLDGDMTAAHVQTNVISPLYTL
mmetsp:Transcript_5338/g.6516  ORF Transcript_5338/g.6516 Transcript_5338/m.6516 type:complete len:264 (-) Transcript_5338:612-1403(-)|eukprot:jgi/Bigna1/88093/estExt_fgenesh1_pg.C_280039